MSPDRHRRDPISFRPPVGDFDWLEQHAEKTGKPVRRILAEALAEYREKHDPDKENER